MSPTSRRFLIAFASREGQTEKIAHHAARRLEDAGHVAHLVDLIGEPSLPGTDGADGVLLAGSMHMGAHDPALAQFIMRHGPELGRLPGAFLSVSLSAASHEENERAAVDEIVRGFLHDTGWQPDHILLVAGAVHDRELNALERVVLHRIVDQHGVQRHPSGDTELTDWPALDRFLDAFAREVSARPVQ